MIGLIILGIVGLYVAAWVFMTCHIRPRWGKALAVLVAVAIPTWDLPFGYYAFRKHCETDGGLRVFGKFSPQEGVFLPGANLQTSILFLRKTGLSFIETKQSTAKKNEERLIRFSVDLGGATSEARVAVRGSNFEIRYGNYMEIAPGLWRQEVTVLELTSSRLFASYSSFRWSGGWIQRMAAPILGDGGSCFAWEQDYRLGKLLKSGS